MFDPPKLSCIVRSGAPLPVPVLEMLYSLGRKIYRQGVSKGKVQFDEQTFATVATKGEIISFCDLVGIQFVGEIITPKGFTNIDYLIRECDLEANEEDMMVSWGLPAFHLVHDSLDSLEVHTTDAIVEALQKSAQHLFGDSPIGPQPSEN